MDRTIVQMMPTRVPFKAFYLDEENNLLSTPVECWAVCHYFCEEHEEEMCMMEPCVLSNDFNILVTVDEEFPNNLVGVFECNKNGAPKDKDLLNEKIQKLKEKMAEAKDSPEHLNSQAN